MLQHAIHSEEEELQIPEPTSIAAILQEIKEGDKKCYLVDDPKNTEKKLLVEIETKSGRYDGEECLLVLVKDISHIIKIEKLKSEWDYSQKLFSTLSQDQLNLLISVLSLSDLLVKDAEGTDRLSNEDRLMFPKAIWSEAMTLYYTT